MSALQESLVELIRRTSAEIPDDVQQAIVRSLENEKKGTIAESAMKIIERNIELAKQKSQPICQDTGSILFYVDCPIGFDQLAFEEAAREAVTFAAIVTAVASGAWLMAWPYVLEFRAVTKIAESSALGDVTSKIKDLDKVAASIASATAEWQHLQLSATHAVTAAEHIAEKMTAEARNFGEVLSRMNESERNHLKLEVDKLRRAEGDWLGIIVRILDHVQALHQAGVRFGQRNVIDQLTHFQNACRDTARRVGIVAIVADAGTPFDASAHQLPDGSKPAEGALIAEVLAPGYTFQGKVIRLPVV